MLLMLAAATALTLTPGQPYAAITRNKLASNKLASNKLASNKLASNGLAQQALSSTRLEATQAAAELLATADGREVYSYIARTMCGFKYAGDCAEFSPEFASPFACDDFDGSESGYSDCRSIDPHTGRARRYREVITTYAAR